MDATGDGKMSQEMKLLTALCEALGFEIETTIDYQERKESQFIAMSHNTFGHPTGRQLKGRPDSNMCDIDSDGLYTSYLTDPIISYKLIKKESQI